MRYYNINHTAVIIGGLINIAASGLGVFSGAWGLRSWNMQKNAAMNMTLGICTASLTLLGFMFIIFGLFLMGLVFLGLLLFFMVFPVLQSVAAYRFKQGRPISMSSRYGYYQNYNMPYQNGFNPNFNPNYSTNYNPNYNGYNPYPPHMEYPNENTANQCGYTAASVNPNAEGQRIPNSQPFSYGDLNYYNTYSESYCQKPVQNFAESNDSKADENPNISSENGASNPSESNDPNS